MENEETQTIDDSKTRSLSTTSYIVSWEEVLDRVIVLSEMIKKSEWIPDFIVPIPRGGLAIALCLSHIMDIPIIHDGDIFTTNKKLLYVDDVVDTGYTANLTGLKLQNSDYKFATLFTKPWSKSNVDYFVKETESWLIFPWEKEYING